MIRDEYPKYIKNSYNSVTKYTIKYYSVLKKNEILPFTTTWMDLEGIILSDNERQILYDFTYMRNLKTQNSQNKTHRHGEKTGSYQKKFGWWAKLGEGVKRYKPSVFKKK